MSFARVKELKEKGLNQSQVARKLKISRETVRKYWDMSEEEYQESHQKATNRRKKPEQYKDFILSTLLEYKDISTAQLYDWIMELEGSQKLGFAERTLRTYVSRLREQENIPKPTSWREYEACDECTPGQQAQVDMGQIKLKDKEGNSHRLICFCMVLSHSRYKFVKWIETSLTTEIFVRLHNEAFQFFGGIPKEVVYDQDAVLAVNENAGDIIYTDGFRSYLDEMRYQVYLCRPSDPESKGKIENVVKYVKGNFAIHRTYTTLDEFNESCFAWLERTGNGKVHQTTKKVPSEVFSLEKDYLQPVPADGSFTSDIKTVSYPVRKDNLIVWKGNRYRVPRGTYHPGIRVYMVEIEGKVHIQDAVTGKVYAKHTICLEKGQIIGERSPSRELPKTTLRLQEEVCQLFGESEDIKKYTRCLHDIKTRYYKDQLYIIRSLFENFPADLIEAGLQYCLGRDIYSATELRSTVVWMKEQQENAEIQEAPVEDLPQQYRGNIPEKRDLSIYEEVFH